MKRSAPGAGEPRFKKPKGSAIAESLDNGEGGPSGLAPSDHLGEPTTAAAQTVAKKAKSPGLAKGSAGKGKAADTPKPAGKAPALVKPATPGSFAATPQTPAATKDGCVPHLRLPTSVCASRHAAAGAHHQC